jgi:hypothetical protein
MFINEVLVEGGFSKKGKTDFSLKYMHQKF